MNSRCVVEIEALRFVYPGKTVAATELTRLALEPGGQILIHGVSGSGKSTLLSLVAGVLIASSGLVKLQDREWSSLNPTARDRHRADHIGYIFQQFNLLGWMNVIDNVILGCAFSPDRKARAIASAGGLERAAMNALEAMQLPASRWRSPGATLSVGEQQRVAAARALIGQPSVILADEPTSALDESLRDPFIGALIEAARQAGSALLLVSHDRALEGRFERRLRLGRAAEGQ